LKYILDASAAIAFFRGEKGDGVVADILSLPRGVCCIHPVNWIELYYKILRRDGETFAEKAIGHLRELGVVITDITGEDFMRRVAVIKNTHPDLSLGDCHAVALAEWLRGTVITSDKRFSEASAFAKIRQIR
jgi:PIN domain nuclease of toxin-antitoxin system